MDLYTLMMKKKYTCMECSGDGEVLPFPESRNKEDCLHCQGMGTVALPVNSIQTLKERYFYCYCTTSGDRYVVVTPESNPLKLFVYLCLGCRRILQMGHSEQIRIDDKDHLLCEEKHGKEVYDGIMGVLKSCSSEYFCRCGDVRCTGLWIQNEYLPDEVDVHLCIKCCRLLLPK